MADKQRILIVDDDANIAELISLYLMKECYDTKIVGWTGVPEVPGKSCGSSTGCLRPDKPQEEPSRQQEIPFLLSRSGARFLLTEEAVPENNRREDTPPESDKTSKTGPHQRKKCALCYPQLLCNSLKPADLPQTALPKTGLPSPCRLLLSRKPPAPSRRLPP